MSLKQNGLLVAVTITKPQLTAKDNKATGDAEAANNAVGAGQYRKDLYPKALVAPITEVESATRAYIRSATLPWGTNSRLLPAAKFFEFSQRLATYETMFNQAVTVFMQNIANVMAAAQQQQGALFDPSLYPDTTTLRAEFSFSPRFMPISDDTDFRVSVNEDELATLRAQMKAQIKADEDALASDAVKRLRAVVDNLRDVMSREPRAALNKKGYVEMRPPVFRDSVVENITEVTEMLKGFAHVLPPRINALVEITSVTGDLNPDALRANSELRAETANNAAALLAEIDAAISGTVVLHKPAPVPPAPTFEPLNPAGLAELPAKPASTPLDELTAKLEEELFATPAAPATPAPLLSNDWLNDLYN